MDDILNIATAVVSAVIYWGPIIITAAAAAAATLPQGQPGTVWGTIRTVIDYLAVNFGNAKNLPKV